MMATFNQAKFDELVLHIAASSEDDPAFGATKLAQILFYSDFLAYGLFGEPITGATYHRFDRGPVPRELLDTVRRLEDSGRVEVVEIPYFNRTQRRLVAKERLDPASLSSDELRLVGQVIEALRHHNARDVSELSHLELGWQVAANRETIPYQTVFLTAQPSQAALERGREIARTLGV